MTRKELIQMIHDEIHTAAIDMLRKSPRQEPSKRNNGNSISEEDMDSVLFFGGEKPKKDDDYSPVTIKESTESVPKITKSEIMEFEKNFRDKIPLSTVVFDQQKNGYSIYLQKKPDGIEAFASGVINVGEGGKIIWSFSILDGAKISSSNFKISQDNKNTFQDIYDFYTSWSKDWREKLTPEGRDTDIGGQQADMNSPVNPKPELPVAGANTGVGISQAT